MSLTAKFFEQSLFPSRLDSISRVINSVYTVDRTGRFNPAIVDYDPIPTYAVEKPYEEVALESAERIWKQHDVVNVFWSGGIDSTLVYYLMRETKPENSILNVRYTRESIHEYPYMWNKELRKKHPILTKAELCDIENVDGVFVSGLAAEAITEKVRGSSWFNEHWIDVYARMDQTQLIRYREDTPFIDDASFARLRKDFLRFAFEYVDYSLFEIRTVYDFRWWAAYALKWDYYLTYFSTHISLEPKYQNRQIAFYRDPDIQAWSLTNRDLVYDGTIESIKRHYRKLILKFNGDKSYYSNKKKVASFMITEPRTYAARKQLRENPNAIQLWLTDGRYWRKNEQIPDTVMARLHT